MSTFVFVIYIPDYTVAAQDKRGKSRLLSASQDAKMDAKTFRFCTLAALKMYYYTRLNFMHSGARKRVEKPLRARVSIYICVSIRKFELEKKSVAALTQAAPLNRLIGESSRESDFRKSI